MEKGQKGCRFTLDARPSMESSGIDVFKTSENAGIGTAVLENRSVMRPEDLPTFTLLLVE
jgi:hypothetical protein